MQYKRVRTIKGFRPTQSFVSTYCVLLSEYDPGVARQHSSRLAEGGFEVVTVTGAEAMAEAFAKLTRLDVAIVDFDLPKLDGLAALARIRSNRPNVSQS